MLVHVIGFIGFRWFISCVRMMVFIRFVGSIKLIGFRRFVMINRVEKGLSILAVFLRVYLVCKVYNVCMALVFIRFVDVVGLLGFVWILGFIGFVLLKSFLSGLSRLSFL